MKRTGSGAAPAVSRAGVPATAPGAAPGEADRAAAATALPVPSRVPVGPSVVPASGAARAGRLPGRPAELLARAAARYASLPVRRRDVAQDAALALTLAVLNLLSLLPYQAQLHPTWLALLLVGGQCLPLALRRVAPVPALLGCGLLRNLYDGFQFGYAPLPLAPAIAFATVADRSGPRLRWLTVAGATAGITWSQAQPGHNQPYDAIVQAFIFGAAWAVGTLSRYRRAALQAAAERAERAEASIDIAAAQAAAAERMRIARELHDVVAHHVSLMAVQAEAVGALLPARPEAAATSADLIGSTARAAMTELRRLLGVLRFTSAEDTERMRLTPVPSLSGLAELVETVRDAGLVVMCEVSGPVAELPPGVDLTAYRILQEALTNAMRHAPGATASVRVACEPGQVTVEVTNSAPAAPSPAPGGPVDPGPAGLGGAPAVQARRAGLAGSVPSGSGPPGSGYGLAGIAERVASCGGSLALGPAADGGFAVTARLPLR
jgi:signal transduction histidine kinase